MRRCWSRVTSRSVCSMGWSRAGWLPSKPPPWCVIPSPRAPVAAPHRLTPTDAQRHAIARSSPAPRAKAFLLHGVTGSGKTLVYIEVLARRDRAAQAERHRARARDRAHAADRRSVPRRLRRPGGGAALRAQRRRTLRCVARAAARREAHRGRRALRDLRPARSTLGAIIVDEEHESSYKQGETPRYHARDVGRSCVRAPRARRVVLGSATPSLESWTQARRRRSCCSRLPDRVGGAQLPAGARDRPRASAIRRAPVARASPECRTSIRDRACSSTRSRSRGHRDAPRARRAEHPAAQSPRLCVVRAVSATAATCRHCPNCAISLTYHRTPERLVCHYCQHQDAGAGALRRLRRGRRCSERGLGTQQVERLRRRTLPRARASRAWTWTRRAGKWAHTDDPRSRGPRRGRHPARHADDREGARLSRT